MNPRGTAYGYLWVDCDKKDVASVEQSLNTLISNTSHIKMDTYHAQLQSAEYASRMMKLGCYLFMAIVGLIGFMNLANTMIINITTKKQEYGVLQAVGMTNKQLNLSLQIQGLIFTVGTICVALAAGLPLGYALFSYAKHNGIFGMNVYHVPLIPILVMILLVGILQIVLSCVLSCNLKKETLVERPVPGLKMLAAANATSTARNVVKNTKIIVVIPIRPADCVAPSEAAPETMETKTRGTTNILISCINKLPKGANTPAVSPIILPTTMPRIIASSI
jgi:uncharacterized membrane protein